MIFEFKPERALTPNDFKNSLLWVGYYKPGDLDQAVEYGWRKSEIKPIVERAGSADGWVFPMPGEAMRDHWHRGQIRSVEFITRSERKLDGFCWVGGEPVRKCFTYVFMNQAAVNVHRIWPEERVNLPDFEAEGRLRLARAYPAESIFPIRARDLLTGRDWEISA